MKTGDGDNNAAEEDEEEDEAKDSNNDDDVADKLVIRLRACSCAAALRVSGNNTQSLILSELLTS